MVLVDFDEVRDGVGLGFVVVAGRSCGGFGGDGREIRVVG